MAASPPSARGTASSSTIKTLCACAFGLGIFSTPLCAQPQYLLSHVLFEAHPVPDVATSPPMQAGQGPRIVPTQGQAVLTATAPFSRFSFLDSPAPRVPTPLLADRQNAEDAIAAYRDTIVDTEGETGPFAAQLFEQLMSLGQAYQRLNQHDDALTALAKAEFISRINNGLYTPDQFAVVERMVESLLASGDMQEALSKQQYLLYLNTQYYGAGSKQLVPALERLGDWSLQAFENGVHGSTSIGIVFTGNNSLNFAGNGPRRQPVVSPRAQSIFNLELAQRRYNQAISSLLEANDFHNPQILGIEEKLLQSIYFGGHRAGLMKDPNFYLDARVDATGSRISQPEFESNMSAFMNGRNALTRTLIYLETNSSADPLARIVTLLNLGDWHALFNRMFDADGYYHQAYALAQTLPERRAEWQPLLQPEIPRQTPAFIALPHSRATFGIADDARVRFDGYVDVEVKLTRSGRVRSLKMHSMTDNTTPQLVKRLRRLLRSAPFRPTLVNGEAVATDSILMRYYFADMREETRT